MANETPLGRTDCGKLCGGKCCKGGENDGMWLFPGEEELLEGKGFEIKKCEANSNGFALVCNGSCNRKHRPLACRFFPLFPVIIEEDGIESVKVIADPRAGLCPLADDEFRQSPRFVRAVRRAGKILAQDKAIHDYLRELSDELVEIMIFKERMGE